MNIDEHSRRRQPAVEESYMTVAIAELPPEGMLVPGVALAGDAQRVTKTDLSLLFTAAGITVQAADPRSESLLAWSGLDGATCQEKVRLTDGRDAAVLELVSDGQSIQFLLPADTVAPGQVAYLAQALPTWLTRYKGASHPDAPPDASPWGAPTAGTNGAARDAFLGGTAAVAGAAVAAHNGLSTGIAPAPQASPTPPPPPPATTPPSTTQWAPPVPPGASVNGLSGVAPAGAPTGWSELPPTVPVESFASTGPTGAFVTSNGQSASTDSVGDMTPDLAVEPIPDRPPKEKARNRGRAAVIALIVVLVALIGVAIYLITKPSGAPTASPATTALAKSINVRLSDLPAGWAVATAAGSEPPPVSALVQLQADRAFATCIGQPLSSVRGWLGAAAFPNRVVTATSPTFQSGTAPVVQIFSTTTVLASTADAQALAGFFDAANFGQCFGQYQAAATVAPATAQVQSVPLTAPAGVKAHGYLTTFTLADHSTVVVGQAFIVGGSTVTVLQPSTNGPSIPSADFGPAFTAVAGRVARAAGQ